MVRKNISLKNKIQYNIIIYMAETEAVIFFHYSFTLFFLNFKDSLCSVNPEKFKLNQILCRIDIFFIFNLKQFLI